MSYLDAVILGIVEGLTEFLPVSSTFHLILAGRALNVPHDDFGKLFEVFIQSGAILSVVVLYFQTLRRDFRLVKKTLVAFIPTAVLGAALYGTIKGVFFESYTGMIAVFLAVAGLFFLFEFLVKKRLIRPERQLQELTYVQAVLIGFLQSFSFLPGVSRAGAVILAMMLLGFRRSDAALFSFLLSIPTLVSAGLYDLYKTRHVLVQSGENTLLLAVGFITAFLVALPAVKWFISYLQRHTLNLFGFYRLLAGGAIILALALVGW